MNTEELEELIQAHQAELFRYLRFIGADYALAQDLVQDAFLRAFRAKVVPELANLRARRAWLRRIAHNLFIDHCRRNSRSPVNFDSEQVEVAEAYWNREFYEHDEGFGCMEALEQCLQTLTAKQRDLVDSFYAARRSRDEIAESLGITSDGVKMALRRTRKALGNCIERRLSEA